MTNTIGLEKIQIGFSDEKESLSKMQQKAGIEQESLDTLYIADQLEGGIYACSLKMLSKYLLKKDGTQKSKEDFSKINNTKETNSITIDVKTSLDEEPLIYNSALWSGLHQCVRAYSKESWKSLVNVKALKNPSSLVQVMKTKEGIFRSVSWDRYFLTAALIRTLKEYGIEASEIVAILKSEGFPRNEICIGMNSEDLFGLESCLSEVETKKIGGNIEELISEHVWLLLGLFGVEPEDGWSAKAYIYRQSDRIICSLFGCIKSWVRQKESGGMLIADHNAIQLIQMSYVECFLDLHNKRAQTHLPEKMKSGLWGEQVKAIKSAISILDE